MPHVLGATASPQRGPAAHRFAWRRSPVADVWSSSGERCRNLMRFRHLSFNCTPERRRLRACLGAPSASTRGRAGVCTAERALGARRYWAARGCRRREARRRGALEGDAAATQAQPCALAAEHGGASGARAAPTLPAGHVHNAARRRTRQKKNIGMLWRGRAWNCLRGEGAAVCRRCGARRGAAQLLLELCVHPDGFPESRSMLENALAQGGLLIARPDMVRPHGGGSGPRGRPRRRRGTRGGARLSS